MASFAKDFIGEVTVCVRSFQIEAYTPFRVLVDRVVIVFIRSRQIWCAFFDTHLWRYDGSEDDCHETGDLREVGIVWLEIPLRSGVKTSAEVFAHLTDQLVPTGGGDHCWPASPLAEEYRWSQADLYRHQFGSSTLPGGGAGSEGRENAPTIVRRLPADTAETVVRRPSAELLATSIAKEDPPKR